MLIFSPLRLIHSWLSVYSKSSGIMVMRVFCRTVSFLLWLEIFARESRCQFQCRSLRAPTTHTPCRCPSSSLEKACRLLLPQCARHCGRPRSAAVAADPSPSSGTASAFREAPTLLSSPTHGDRRILVCPNRRRIRVPPRSDFVLARDRNH